MSPGVRSPVPGVFQYKRAFVKFCADHLSDKVRFANPPKVYIDDVVAYRDIVVRQFQSTPLEHVIAALAFLVVCYQQYPGLPRSGLMPALIFYDLTTALSASNAVSAGILPMIMSGRVSFPLTVTNL